METFLQDLRFAIRGWRGNPGFAIAAIGTLALGIGVNTAIFSVVNGVLLRPLGFVQSEKLVQLSETQPRDRKTGGFEGTVVYRDFEEWRMRSRLFDGMVAYKKSAKNLQGMGEPEQVQMIGSETGLFQLLGSTAFIGQTFSESDAPNVVVASHAFWTSHFGADRSAIGRTLTLDGQSYTLIGVMPQSFQFPYNSAPTALWTPWPMRSELSARPNARLEFVLGRLKPGVPLESARQELAAMEETANGHRTVQINYLQDVVTRSSRDSLLILLGAAGMVLLVACVNVANLLLARTASRLREISIRTALGATRLRLMSQFLTESVLLAFVGGAAGLAIGIWARSALISVAATQIPRADEIGLDWRVFAFLLGVCLISGVGFGFASAIAAARGGVSHMKRNTNLQTTLRHALVVVQIGLAFVLLTGEGLLLRTFINLQRTDPGLNPENVLTAHIVVSGAPESQAIEERVAQIPGVTAVGSISLLPLQNSNWAGFLTVPGRAEMIPTQLRYITPSYFRAMGIPLRQGREFSRSDGRNTPIAILINEAMARLLFPGEDPVGRTTSRGMIIGVVGDVRQHALRVPPKPEVYYTTAQNFAQLNTHGFTLVVRGSGSSEALAGMIRAAVREVSPGQAVFRIATMRQVIDESLANQRLYTWLLGLFAAIGALVTVAGVYGVIAYMTALRMREFGIRMALGADTNRVLRLVMNRGALLILLGLAFGITGAAVLTRVLSGLLYGVSSTDPLTFLMMSAAMGIVGLTACLAPAIRASRVDPATVLRSE